MKKITCSVLLAFLLTFFAAAEEDFFSNTLGLSTGFPLYGSNTLSQDVNEISTDKRVIIGVFYNFNINVIKQISFFAGADILCDFNWNADFYKHFLHTGIPVGLKIYPGLAGFSLGMAYEFGFRTDFIKYLTGEQKVLPTAWGNGFKFMIDKIQTHAYNRLFLEFYAKRKLFFRQHLKFLSCRKFLKKIISS